MARRRPRVISTRVLDREAELLRACAAAEGVSVAEEVHRLLLPAVRERLKALAESEGSDVSSR